MRQGKRHITHYTYDSTNQLVSAANPQTDALSVTYGDWGKIQEYGLSQTDLASNTTTSQTRYYSYGSLNEGQTTFAPNSISYADGTNVNEQYGINGSLLRRETTIPNSTPSEELYRFGADGNMRLYSYDRLFYSLYGYDGETTRTYKYSMDLSPNWVNGQLLDVNFNPHTAMFYPNSYLNFNSNGYYTKHYYNGTERIASRLGDQNLPINVNDPELQDHKDQLDTNIRRNIVEITGYNFLSDGEEPDPDNPKPHYDLPHIGVAGLQPSADGIYYYHTNHLGSTCYVTDDNTSVVQGFLYAPFGEITNEYNVGWQNGTLPKYSFNAKELDEETGMYYYEARYYAPPIFISRDVLFEEKPWFTPYHYCSNNPVVRVDPSGMLDDWYRSEDGSATIWREGNAETIEVDGETYHNIGENYSYTQGNTTFNYNQNDLVSVTEHVLNPSDYESQMKPDGSGKKPMPEGNCFVQSGKMVAKSGTTSYESPSNNISNPQKGIDYINNQIDKGFSVRVHVDRTSDGVGDHWVAISSRTTNFRTGEVSFGFYDPAKRFSSKGTKNTFKIIGGKLLGSP